MRRSIRVKAGVKEGVTIVMCEIIFRRQNELYKGRIPSDEDA